MLVSPPTDVLAAGEEEEEEEEEGEGCDDGGCDGQTAADEVDGQDDVCVCMYRCGVYIVCSQTKS